MGLNRQEVREVGTRILDWYRRQARDLPWRRTRDPYLIWVSEVMLQQTRVDTVIPYFLEFVRRWPDVNALACAELNDVRAAWSGLGYYRRAELMLKAAASIVRDHDGRLPGSAQALTDLPGFGRYTAGAVASIAFGEPVAAVDGNVERVVARLLSLQGDPRSSAGSRRVWSLATALAEVGPSSEINQGLMELGALVCTKAKPLCDGCPIRMHCRALASDRVRKIPPPRRRAPRVPMNLSAVVGLAGPRTILLAQRPTGGLFSGLFCPPLLEGHLEAAELSAALRHRYGWCVRGVEWAGEVKHSLTHRELVIRIARVRGPVDSQKLVKVDVRRLSSLGLPNAALRILEVGLEAGDLRVAALAGRRSRGGQTDATPARPAASIGRNSV